MDMDLGTDKTTDDRDSVTKEVINTWPMVDGSCLTNTKIVSKIPDLPVPNEIKLVIRRYENEIHDDDHERCKCANDSPQP